LNLSHQYLAKNRNKNIHFELHNTNQRELIKIMRKIEQQYESLVRSYYQSLYRYAFWASKNKAVAEDLVQETFEKAWKNIHQLKDIDSAKPWLFTILNRENARRFSRKQLEMVKLTEEWNFEHIADKNNAIEKVSLQRAILKLPIDYREPLVLQIEAGFSTDEIAAIMNLNSNTVSTRLFRARTALKEMMSTNDNKKDYTNG
jgi:RNA polymerase sigma-70 factor (ECF subfamily)